ncbi:MAG: hypothetical protein WBE37_19275 [Bryobacteraceae bacterium]
MIHLQSMFSPETNTSTAGQNTRAPLSEAKLNSFHGALSDAVSSTLEKFGIHPNAVNISVTRSNADPAPPSTGTNTPARSTPPAPGTPASAGGASSGATPSTSSTAPNSGYDPFLQAASSNPFSSTPTPSSTEAAPTYAAPVDAQQAFDNAYWASQPAPVQALQKIQDPTQRAAMATELANEGYSIDVPIMVWGWDPSITTAMRQADGYTWVPSALQSGVEMAPGLPAMGTVAAYDPNNPPAGSIPV